VIVPSGTSSLPQFQNIAQWSNYTIPNQVFNFNNTADAAFAPIGCQAGKTASQTCTFNWYNYTGTPVYSIGTDFVGYNATGAWKIHSNLTNLDQFIVFSGGTRTVLPASGTWQIFNHTAGTGVAQINESNGALYANEDMNDGIYASLAGTTGSVGSSSLAAGACFAGTANVVDATTSMVATTSPATYPGDSFTWRAYVSSAGTVTVKVCNETAAAATPTTSVYNVRVIQ
jgi:hypothetical protein